MYTSMMKATLLCAGLLLAVVSGASRASAQESRMFREAADVQALSGPSPGVAQAVSVLATLGPVAAGLAAESPELFAVGFYLGPATGYWIGGAAGRGWAGVGLRTGATLLGAGLVSAAWGGSWTPSDEAAAVSLGVFGVLAYLVIHDLVEVDDVVRARRVERSEAQATGSGIELSPVVSPSDGGTLGIVGSIRL